MIWFLEWAQVSVHSGKEALQDGIWPGRASHLCVDLHSALLGGQCWVILTAQREEESWRSCAPLPGRIAVSNVLAFLASQPRGQLTGIFPTSPSASKVHLLSVSMTTHELLRS